MINQKLLIERLSESLPNNALSSTQIVTVQLSARRGSVKRKKA
jgi:hypothetical protein